MENQNQRAVPAENNGGHVEISISETADELPPSLSSPISSLIDSPPISSPSDVPPSTAQPAISAPTPKSRSKYNHDEPQRKSFYTWLSFLIQLPMIIAVMAPMTYHLAQIPIISPFLKYLQLNFTEGMFKAADCWLLLSLMGLSIAIPVYYFLSLEWISIESLYTPAARAVRRWIEGIDDDEPTSAPASATAEDAANESVDPATGAPATANVRTRIRDRDFNPPPGIMSLFTRDICCCFLFAFILCMCSCASIIIYIVHAAAYGVQYVLEELLLNTKWCCCRGLPRKRIPKKKVTQDELRFVDRNPGKSKRSSVVILKTMSDVSIEMHDQPEKKFSLGSLNGGDISADSMQSFMRSQI